MFMQAMLMNLPGFVKSVQPFEITIAANATSNTASITGVAITNAVIFLNGFTSTELSSTFRLFMPRAEITNSTTITVYRDTLSATKTVTVRGTVVEFISGAINSVQSGTITIANGATTGTVPIASVNTALSVAFYLGHTITTTTTTVGVAFCRVDLTNATTITATRASSGTSVLTVGYAVIEFNAAVIASVQQRAATFTSSSLTDTDTINAVSMANTMLIYNGVFSTVAVASMHYYLQLTSTTAVTLTRTGVSTTSRTVGYTVLEFKPGMLKSIQRGSTSLSGATSAATAITAVKTGKAFANGLHFDTASSTTDAQFASSKLANAVSIQSDRATDDGSATVTGWEVPEFF